MRSFSHIRGFLLDMDGTFYLGERLLPGAVEFLEALRATGRKYLFLTNNSSKSAEEYAAKLRRLVSLPPASPDEHRRARGPRLPLPPGEGRGEGEFPILTSGEAAALYLRAQARGARVCVIGTPALEQEFARHGFVLDKREPQAVVLGFDTGLTYTKLMLLCNFVRRGIPYIATHPDLNCPTESGPIPDIGATIAFVQASTGRLPDEVVGKPNRLIVEIAARKLGLPVESLAMVGDRLYTDIALGASAGVRTCLVLTGETRREDLAGSPFQPDDVFEDLGEMAEEILEK